MEQKVSEIIADAEMILVGIGGEFSPVLGTAENSQQNNDETAINGIKYNDEEHKSQSMMLDYCRKSQFYEKLSNEHEVIQAYDRLRTLIGVKPYFVVTLNTDDLIYRSQLEDDLIVAPCGSLGKMQCGEHIVDASSIRDSLLAGENKEPCCPVCGRPLQFHVVDLPGYMEQGYLPRWQKYTKWLQYTLNRKLCILELGVGFEYPQVIRFPFEKTAFYNQKATLVRVNSRFPQLTKEISQRGISVAQNPVRFLEYSSDSKPQTAFFEG